MSLPFPTVQIMLGITFVGDLVLMRRRLSSDSSRQADRGSLRLLIVVICASVSLAWLAARLFPQASVESLFNGDVTAIRSLYGAGLALFGTGLALRWYSVRYLGRLFTYDVAIAADHRVVDSGPYRYVRHPAYTGSLLTFLGVGICGGNVVSLGVLMVPIAWAFMHRIAIEEAALNAALGSGYADYAARTRRLVPFIF